MKTFTDIRCVSEGIIKKDSSNPENPELVISGFGVWTFDSLRASVDADLKEMGRLASAGRFDQINHMIDRESSSFRTKINALIQAEKEMSTPGYKRKIQMAKFRK